MPKLRCTLENAATEISGVKFAKQEDGSMLSENVGDDVAGVFLSINGYEQVEDDADAKPKAAPKSPAAKPAAKPTPKPAAKPAAKAEEPVAKAEEPKADTFSEPSGADAEQGAESGAGAAEEGPEVF